MELFRKDSATVLGQDNLPERATKGFYAVILTGAAVLILIIKARIWVKKSGNDDANLHDWSMSAKNILAYKANLVFTVLFILLYVLIKLQPRVRSKANLYLMVTSLFSNIYPFAIINGKEKMKERTARWWKGLWEGKRDKLRKALKNVFKCAYCQSNQISPIV